MAQFPNVEKAVSAVEEILNSPYGSHIHDKERTIGWADTESVTAVLLHLLQLWNGDKLDRDSWKKVLGVDDVRQKLVKGVYEEAE